MGGQHPPVAPTSCVKAFDKNNETISRGRGRESRDMAEGIPSIERCGEWGWIEAHSESQISKSILVNTDGLGLNEAETPSYLCLQGREWKCQ